MATILLSAAGAAIGGLSSGTVLGMTGAVVGRAVGATLGRVIDQRLLGVGSDPVERGRIERLRITGAGEGAPIAQLFGRMRLGGQVIWATQFVEKVSRSGGGKGAPPQPKVARYSYCVSLAVALCEGEIRRIGRIWADGVELDRSTVTMRVYKGSEDQLPDPLIEAVEGAGAVPAYRGLAYVVFEDLDLTPFGNRVPQFSFEVTRAAQPNGAVVPAAADMLRAIALMPGTGEYVLSTRQITYNKGFGKQEAANVSAEGGGTDFVQSLAQARDVLPKLQSVSLIYSWFGDDLRAGCCEVKPKVEDKSRDGRGMPWRAGGITRSAAEEIARIDDRPVYGGTPSDQSVIEAIQAIHEGGQTVLFYPFLLMEILAGNGLPDPYGGSEQARLPWRGRITGDLAPGQDGSPDGTAANRAAVEAFFGSARASDFAVGNGSVSYSGPSGWGYARFILHSAALCAAAGGVEAFCIGTEMRGLTRMRDDLGFPAVERFRALAAEVRQLLPEAKLTYAADWSEYFGYQPQDGTGDVFFHLDPLWADEAIDFVAIDNYMPLSDWRDGLDHSDAGWGAVYSLDYLQANIEGGEGYDWSYPSEEARAAQRREPITDGLFGEPWVFRYKALRDWWQEPHYNRISGPGGWALPDGNRPDLWAAVGGATRVPVGGGTGLFAHAVEISDAAGTGGAELRSPAFPGVADALYSVRLLYRSGSATDLRLRIEFGGATPAPIDFSGAVGALDVVQSSGHVVQKIVNAVEPDGTHVLSFEVVFASADEAARVSFGPLGGVAGETVTLVGIEVVSREALRTGWVPQSKPIWFTEFGCPAVDKGTNEPNKFVDAKSSESALPRYSNGRRDDLIQAQYLRAVLSYWDDPQKNPVSEVYGGPMLDMDRAFAWAWDARPWPAFPNDLDRWSDGGNWRRGHWLTGRIEAAPLDHVVAELCEAAGVRDYDVSGLYGRVLGHISGETESARARLQALMLAYGFQAVEREGRLVFRPLPDRPDAIVVAPETARDEDGVGDISEMRAAEAETTGRVRVGFVAAEAEYEDRVADAVFPGDGSDLVSATALPLALTGAEGQAVAERWLAEARVARDSLRLALPRRSARLRQGRWWRLKTVLPGGSTGSKTGARGRLRLCGWSPRCSSHRRP